MPGAARGLCLSMPDVATPGDPGPADGLEVYWRPGCGFCTRLFRHLERAGVSVRLHNIWEDDEARRFVRRHNRGNETVPTVSLGGQVRTNPSPDALIEEIRASHPHLIGEEAAPAGLWGRRRR